MTDNPVTPEIKAILSRRYNRLITGDPDEGYLTEVLELDGCVTAGDTPEEALRNLDEGMAVWVESALAHGDPIPVPHPGPVQRSA
jgi:predicted RNase H-like HicB family nuclease